MKRKDIVVAIIVGIILGFILFKFRGYLLLRDVQHVQASTTATEVLNRVLTSHLNWKTAKGEALITYYGKLDSSPQSFVNRFEVSQPDLAYFENQSVDQPEKISTWISNGEKAVLNDSFNEKTETYEIPNFAKDLSILPKTMQEIKDDQVISHPFALIVPFPIKEYLYPAGFAQGKGTFELLGEEEIILRKAFKIKYIFGDSKTNPNGSTYSLAWIDSQTGIILKFVQYRPDYAKGISTDFIFQSLELDGPVDLQKMSLP